MNPPAADAVTLDAATLDLAMPMHLRLDPEGRVTGAGRAILRVAGSRRLVGVSLFELVEFSVPCSLDTPGDLAAHAGRPLILRFRAPRRVEFRGHLLAGRDGGFVLNLALGLAELPDLGGARLTASEFAPTDPTVDMLYLMEAKTMAFAEMRRLVERLEGAKSAAEEQAFTDTLTGVGNRRALDRVLARALERDERFALCHIDLDHFKQVNDTHGHAAGDAVLRAVAMRLSHAVRAGDTVARVGGDEFIVIFAGLTDPITLDRIAMRIVAELQEPVAFDGRTHRVSASIGIALSTAYRDLDAGRMIADADAALYQSKATGRATHTIHARPA